MQHFTQAEIRQIEDCYQDFFNLIKEKFDSERLVRIEKAFRFANAAHEGIKRKAGEPYIVHPIAVAKIVAGELGLGATSIEAALLHDVVEDTDYSVSDIENMFGRKVAGIVDGLTKLSGDFDARQALTLKKILTSLSIDVRIILIKLADRLHNMQTLDAMPPHKKLKIAGETLYLYVPISHRLGLHAIKTQLEELSFKHRHPEEYNQILFLLHNQEEKLNYLVNEFIAPLKKKLDEDNVACTVTHRLKSTYSIWQKMQKKGISFSEVYDLLAIRIVIKPKPHISEKKQCFEVLSTVTDIYKPRPERIRDWITLPKANGYESLHVTVMGKQGKWVEVQIRTERMDEVAEHGFAAHYRYKDIRLYESELENWIDRIREQLRNPNVDAFEFLEDFKLNLFTNEINVFTPKGDMITLPVNSTVIDFAYEIHTYLGNKCIGAKINQKLVPISYTLHNSDQVEILTSENQSPKLEWLKIATTTKARSKIKDVFRLEKKKHIEQGKSRVEEAFLKAGTAVTSDNLKKVIAHFNLNNKEQLYADVGMGYLELGPLDEILGRKLENKWVKYWNITFNRRKKVEATNVTNDDSAQKTKKIDTKKTFFLNNEPDETTYALAKCCNPIPGEKVIGFLSTDEHVIIHKSGCKEIEKLLVSQGERFIAADWTKSKKQSFLTRLKLNGIDRLGIVSDVTGIISKELNINMRSVKFETNDNIFEGELFLYIHNMEDLVNLTARLKKIKGIHSIHRIENLHD